MTTNVKKNANIINKILVVGLTITTKTTTRTDLLKNVKATTEPLVEAKVANNNIHREITINVNDKEIMVGDTIFVMAMMITIAMATMTEVVKVPITVITTVVAKGMDNLSRGTMIISLLKITGPITTTGAQCMRSQSESL